VILSLIIPTLDEGAIIRTLLESLQPLRASGHQVILVDGGSGDDTLGQARGLVDLALTAPAGRASQMNIGAEAAAGEVLWFVHADSLLPSGAAQTLLDGLARRQRLWGRFDVSLDARGLLFRLTEVLISWRSRLTGIATGDQGLFVRRGAFFEVGGFPPLPLMEDVALSRHLKRLGRPLALRLRIRTSARRWEQRGPLRTILLMWRLRLAFFLGADPTKLAESYVRCSSPTQES